MAEITKETREKIIDFKRWIQIRKENEKVCCPKDGTEMVLQEYMRKDYDSSVNPWRCPKCNYFYLEESL